MLKKNFIFFFGPPASGKGTQSDMLGAKLKLPVISPGELLRQEEDAHTKIGEAAKGKMAQGELVPDEVVEEILTKRLSRPDTKNGFILDGFPRNQAQLNFALKMIGQPENSAPDKTINTAKVVAVYIEVSDNEVKERIGGRRVCDCGATYHLKVKPPKKAGICDICNRKLFIRQDDKPAVINSRLRIFHQEILPVIDWFDANHYLLKIKGEGKINEIAASIYSAVAKAIGNV